MLRRAAVRLKDVRTTGGRSATGEKILEAAVKVLNRKEYYLCPVEDIARAAGVAKGTIYLYCKSKEELYYKVFFRVLDKLKTVADGILARCDRPSECLEAFLETFSGVFADNRNIFLSLRRELRMGDKRMREKLHAKMSEVTSAVARIVEKGVRSGEFADYDPRLVATMFASLIFIVAHHGIEKDMAFEGFSPKIIMKVFLNGLKRR